jgi:tetratricopeptide (TPR) repeat protein
MLRACILIASVAFAQDRGVVLNNATPLPMQPRARVALVIGNGNYRAGQLKNPINDARSMYKTLTDLGFAVELATDADARKLRGTIDTFTSRRLHQGDVAVFYYAGHGMQIDSENYLIPTDFDSSDEILARRSAYPANLALEAMERSGAQLRIIILDACRNNPYSGSRALGGGGLATMTSGAGTFIAFATAPGKTASDNAAGANGLFTTYLLESLKQPGLTLDEVFNKTREEVVTASKKFQTPWTQSSVIGRFYFRPPGGTLETGATDVAVSSAVRQRPGETSMGGDSAYQQGVRQSRVGALANAVDAFTEAIRKNPENVEAYYERAMSHASLGQFQQAIDDFNQVLRHKPNDTNALIGRGASYINISDYGRALPDLDHVIRQEPENDNAYFDRGLAFASLGENQKALDDYSQVIRRRPKWPSTWYNRGIVHATASDFKSAIADYTEAVRLRADYAAAFANRGVARAELGDLPHALTDLDAAIRLKPDDAAMLNSRGMVLLWMKQPAKALEEFNEAIRLNPLLGIAYYNRSEVRKTLGDNAGGDADLKRARELGVH